MILCVVFVSVLNVVIWLIRGLLMLVSSLIVLFVIRVLMMVYIVGSIFMVL